MKKNLLIIGLLVSILSLISAFLGVHNWYFPATIGVWIFFDSISSIKNKNTPLQILKRSKPQFLNLYLIMMILGLVIELVGRFIFNLWSYPFINNNFKELLIIIFYPFILFSFAETYRSLKIKIKSNVQAFVLSMIIGIIIWEIPNLVSKDWIYKINFFPYEILGINILVIIGWSFLIALPLYVYKNILYT